MTKRCGMKAGLLAAGMMLICLPACSTQKDFWGKWPEDRSPEKIGKMITLNLLPRPVPAAGGAAAAPVRNGVALTQPATTQSANIGGATQPGGGRGGRGGRGGQGGFATTGPGGGGRGAQVRRFTYPEVCTAYGVLRFVGEIQDKELMARVVKRYDLLLTPEGAALMPPPISVDNSVIGILPLEMYKQTGDEKYIALGKKNADAQWANLNEDGLTTQSRFWIDDMFMITALQTNTFRATKDKVYLDHAAKEMVAYLDRLQEPSGLFYHGLSAHYYWGRGDGWMAAGMAELLSELPEDHPQRARILEGYRKMMAALLKYQDKSGMWHQLIDKPEAFLETSGSGMFTFSMARGVRNGWLDAATYMEPAKRAWIALAGYVDSDGNVKDVCAGTNQTRTTDDASLQFYLNRPRNVGDLHGQAATIWAAWAVAK